MRTIDGGGDKVVVASGAKVCDNNIYTSTYRHDECRRWPSHGDARFMIILRDICLSFGQHVVFDRVNAAFDPQAKSGLVGDNGSGKSTLLNVIAGNQHLDSGSVDVPRTLRVAYMPQDTVLASERTVLDEVLTAFAELGHHLDRLRELEERVNGQTATDQELEEYAVVVHELHEHDYHGKQAQAHQMLAGLGFGAQQYGHPVASLSVGWKMRLVLAKLLISRADFYLFDEPTNHLDLVAKDWFADFLRKAPFGFLLVCHDRYFLDTLCGHIWHLRAGKLTCYTGNYTAYLTKSEHAKRIEEKKYLEQQKYVKKQEATIARFRAKATKATMAQSMIKALEKVERIEPAHADKTMRMSIRPTRQPGRIVLTVHDLAFAFTSGEKVFENISFEIERGKKVALVAANGVGKSTLLHVIMGAYKPFSGTVALGHNVTSVFFAQDQNAALTASNTILEEVESVCVTSDDRARVRTLLGSFLFSGESVDKKIGVLSGGEKNRVAMVKTLLVHANFLILDEPTNHLDLASKDVLLEALTHFDGTILFVSHDRDFLNNLATDIIELTPHGVVSYAGTYDAYLYHKHREQMNDRQQGATNESHKRPGDAGSKDAATQAMLQETRDRRKRIAQLEKSITKRENELAQCSLECATLVYGTASYKQAHEKLRTIEQELKKECDEWEKLV